MIIIDVSTYEELETWLRTEKTQMFNEMVSEVHFAWQHNLDLAHVAKAELSNGVKVKIDLPAEEWFYTLDKCRDYFEEQEMYEVCIKINRIKQEMENGVS